VTRPTQPRKLAGMFQYTNPVSSIAWGSLRDCYGPATGATKALEDVLADDEEVRMGAFDDWLMGHAWHQGTIYQVTGYLVPFLVDLVCGAPAPTRGRAATCLALFAISAAHGSEKVYGQHVLVQMSRSIGALADVAAKNTVLRGIVLVALAQLHAQRSFVEHLLAKHGLSAETDRLRDVGASQEMASAYLNNYSTYADEEQPPQVSADDLAAWEEK
jgi:hypothetical protein